MRSSDTPPQESNISESSLINLISISQVHVNVTQEVIITTEDKVVLCLSAHLKRVEKKNGWIAPLGVLLTIIVTLVTTNFHDLLFSAATWQAIFIISGMISLYWLIRSYKEARKSEKVEDIVAELKKHSPVQQKESNITI